MLHTTKGIVFNHFKYSEKSVIVKIYTEKFGLQSYIINAVRSKKSKNKLAYLQVLSIVEINAYHKENKGLQRIKDIKLSCPFQSIPFNIFKGSIAFFITETLIKSIKEEPILFISKIGNDSRIKNVGIEKNEYLKHFLYMYRVYKYTGIKKYTFIKYKTDTI